MLHVPGPDLNQSPSSMLNQVHQSLYNHYKQQALKGVAGGGGSKEDAALLQEFLTAWKSYANRSSRTHNTSQLFTNEILAQLESKFPPSLKNSLFKFNASGGKKFETELTKFIYGILEGNGSTGMSLQQFLEKANTGSVRTTAEGLNGDFLDKMGYEFTQVLAEGVSNEVRMSYERAQADIGKLRNSLSLTPIQIKTDISTKGVNVQMAMNDATSSPLMTKIYSLLSKATITAKNYGSADYIARIREARGMIADAVHLGDTNTYRAVLSVLRSVGWSDDVINSVYYATYSARDETALTYLAHIRFIYELTGRGQIVNGILSDVTDADYLIWNDPSSTSTITVTSTAALIEQVFDEMFETDMSYGVHIRFVNLK